MFICENCDTEMDYVSCSDHPFTSNKAWNIYHCLECGTLCKEDVWQDAGEFWIFPDRTTKFIEK